jgi:hypothetical protein
MFLFVAVPPLFGIERWIARSTSELAALAKD